MKVAFDEHVARGLVHVFNTLGEDKHLIKHTFHAAGDYAIDIDNGDDAPWMRRFADDGGQVVITGDIRIRKLLHQQKAYMECGLLLYMFPPVWSNYITLEKSAFLLKWWRRLSIHMAEAKRPSCWQMPAHWTGGELKDVTRKETKANP